MNKQEIINAILEANKKMSEYTTEEPVTLMGSGLASFLLTAAYGRKIRVAPDCPSDRFIVGAEKDINKLIVKKFEIK